MANRKNARQNDNGSIQIREPQLQTERVHDVDLAVVVDVRQSRLCSVQRQQMSKITLDHGSVHDVDLFR